MRIGLPPLHGVSRLPKRFSQGGDSGFEPLTSSALRKSDAFLEVSTACKIPANSDFYSNIAFLLLSVYQLALLPGYSVRHILNCYAVPAMLEETAGSLINIAFGLMYLTVAVVQLACC